MSAPVAVAPSTAAPRHADAGRRAYFRSFLTGRGSVYTMVLGASAVVVYGAYRGEPLIMLAGPPVIVALVVAVCALLADRLAAERFFASFARRHGLAYVRHAQLHPLTPLLGAGDRHWCEHWMIGQIASSPPLPGGVGHFVYEVRSEWTQRDGHGFEHRHEVTRERQRLTLGVIDIEASMALFKGVFVHPRRGLLEHRSDWLDHPGAREIEVESAAFTERYQLRLAADQDEGLARQLLSPSLVDWLAGHPLLPGLELRAGTLVVFCQRVLEDAGNLTFFLEAMGDLARRVVKEIGEVPGGPAPKARQSVPPPSVV